MTTVKKAAKTADKPAHAAAKPAAKKTGKAAGHVAALDIEGIGPKFEAKLRKAGIKTSEDLANLADVKGVADKTGIPEANVRLWKSMAVLLPVKGIGPQFAEVLARTGVADLKDLAGCDPKKLAARVEALIESKQVTIVGVTPDAKRIKAWVEHAKELTAPEEKAKAPKIKGATTGKVEARVDAADPTPKQAKKFSSVAAEIQAATSNALPRPMKVRAEHPEIKDNQAGSLKWAEEAFWAFFGDEIEALTSYPASIHGDRSYVWRCECCDAPLRVPRRTTVYHGDYEIVHDDSEGLLVNGVRHVPGAYTKGLEVVQPGRLRNPWTGKLIEGRDLGTTGVKTH